MSETQNPESADFSDFDVLRENQEQGTPLRLRHPTRGTHVGAILRVVSYESRVVKDKQRELTERRVREGRRVSTPDEEEAENVEIMASAVVGFDVAPIVDGQPLEYSQANVRSFLNRFRFVRTQIDGHAGSLSAFLQT